MISVGVRLAAFNLKQIANLTCTDELDLYSIGEKKVALFCCIPDADTSMNYLVGMIYSKQKNTCLRIIVGMKKCGQVTYEKQLQAALEEEKVEL